MEALLCGSASVDPTSTSSSLSNTPSHSHGKVFVQLLQLLGGQRCQQLVFNQLLLLMRLQRYPEEAVVLPGTFQEVYAGPESRRREDQQDFLQECEDLETRRQQKAAGDVPQPARDTAGLWCRHGNEDDGLMESCLGFCWTSETSRQERVKPPDVHLLAPPSASALNLQP